MDTIECNINEIKTLVSEMKDQRNKQLIGWGVGIIGTLIGAVSFLVYNLIKLKS
jgi:hypothetical protein